MIRPIPEPRLVRWHVWSLLAVLTFRAERALGPLGGVIAPLKWWCLARADDAYPGARVVRRDEEGGV